MLSANLQNGSNVISFGWDEFRNVIAGFQFCLAQRIGPIQFVAECSEVLVLRTLF